MDDMRVKVLFEVTEEGQMLVELIGNGGIIRAALSTLIEQLARVEETTAIEIVNELKEGIQINDDAYGKIIQDIMNGVKH